MLRLNDDRDARRGDQRPIRRIFASRQLAIRSKAIASHTRQQQEKCVSNGRTGGTFLSVCPFAETRRQLKRERARQCMQMMFMRVPRRDERRVAIVQRTHAHVTAQRDKRHDDRRRCRRRRTDKTASVCAKGATIKTRRVVCVCVVRPAIAGDATGHALLGCRKHDAEHFTIISMHTHTLHTQIYRCRLLRSFVRSFVRTCARAAAP